jgi:hypothetical protein
MGAKVMERFIQLGWEILEHKFTYYHPEKVHPSWKGSSVFVNDAIYDAKEGEYRALAKKLGDPPAAADPVDSPSARPAGRLVESKLTKKAPK